MHQPARAGSLSQFPWVVFSFLVLYPVCSVATCYLEDATANCEVCWKTQYSGPGDKTGVTTMAECPSSVVLTWESELPQMMYAGATYTVQYKFWVNQTAVMVVPKATAKEGLKEIPHANIHSCVASRGACTPFVSNTPGLSTHTPALTSDFNDEGFFIFTSDVKLTEEVYTIIAHLRFYTPNSLDPAYPPTKYDIAVGISRTVLEQTVKISADSIISACIMGAILVMVFSTLMYAVRKKYFNLAILIEVLWSETSTLFGDILTGLADVAAFTVGVFTVLQDNNDVKHILPFCYLFCAIAWIGSIFNATNDVLQLRAMYLQNNHRQQFVKEMVDRKATTSVDVAFKGVKGVGRDERRRSVQETSENFTELIAEQEHYDTMLEMELADRDYRRKMGDLVTILSESLPITGIQGYVLTQGSAHWVTVIALIFASLVLGAKFSGLGQFHAVRQRRDEARKRFDATFQPRSQGPGGNMNRVVPVDRESSDASVTRQLPPSPVKTVTCGNHTDAIVEIGNDLPPGPPGSGSPPRSGSRGERPMLRQPAQPDPVAIGWFPTAQAF